MSVRRRIQTLLVACIFWLGTDCPGLALDSTPPLNITSAPQAKFELSSMIEFVEKPTSSTYGYKMKPWTSQEQKTVSDALTRAFELAPGLVKLATGNSKLKLYRANDLRGEVSRIAIAMTLHDGIMFSNLFFERDDKFRTVLHELVHAADSGERFSQSKEWIDFAQPIVAEVRAKQVVGVSDFSWTDSSEEHCYFRANGSKNLSESLAEYYSRTLYKLQRWPTEPAIAQLTARLSTASKEDCEFIRCYRSGTVFLRQEQYDAAMLQFMTMKRLFPAEPAPRLQLAYCLWKRRRCEEASKEAVIAQASLEAAGVPKTEWTINHVLCTRAYILAYNRDYAQARAMFAQIKSNDPYSKYWFLASKWVNELAENYADAAVDLYCSEMKRTVATCSAFATKKPAEVFKLFDDGIKSGDHLGMTYRRRARFCEALADRESDPSLKRTYYEKAISDLTLAMEYLDCDLVDSLFDCAQLSFKMGDSKTASAFADSIAQLPSGSLGAKVIQFQIFASTHKGPIVFSEYDKLQKSLTAKHNSSNRVPIKTSSESAI